MTDDQIEKLAEVSADIVGFRYVIPELTERVKALETGRQDTRVKLEELRQKVETQAAQIEALQKSD